MEVLPAWMSVYHVYTSACGSQKKSLDFLRLELHTVVNWHVGAGHQPWSSVRVTSALKCCDISLAPQLVLFKRLIYFYVMFKHVFLACISVPYLYSWCLWMSEEGIGSPGTGVEDGCEPQWVLGIEPGALVPLLE